MTWIRDDHLTIAPKTEVDHLDGVPWWEAPIPWRWHRCKPQTRAWLNYLTFVERCACGSIRKDNWHGCWVDKNARRAR